MLKIDKTIILTDGTEHKIPLSEDVREDIVCIRLSITGVNRDGMPLTPYQNQQVKTSIHTTMGAIHKLGYDVTTPRDVAPSVEDHIVDFLADLGVRFED
jgi:hypothetical protein